MGTCKFCGEVDKTLSEILQVCRTCILEGDWNEIKSHLLSVHKLVRQLVNLPEIPPKAAKPFIKLKTIETILKYLIDNQPKILVPIYQEKVGQLS